MTKAFGAPYGWALWIFSGTIYFTTYKGDGSAQTNLAWSSGASAGWHLYVAWRDSVAGKIWLSVDNATPVSANTAYPDTSSSGPFAIGGASPYYLIGEMAYAGIWGRTFTSQDRTDLWNAGVPRRYSDLTAGLLTGLVDYYSLDTPSHLTVGEANGHTLTNNSVTLSASVGLWAAHPIQDGYYATTYPDQSGNGNDLIATPIGTPAWTANIRNGLPAFAGDGTSCYLYSDALAAYFTGTSTPFSIGFAFKFGPLSATYQPLWECVAYLATDVDHDVTEVQDNGAGNYAFVRQKSNVPTTLAGGFTDTNWHRILCTYDGTTGKVYLDGALLFSGSFAAVNNQVIDRLVYMAHQAAFEGIVPNHLGVGGYFGEDIVCSGALSEANVVAWDAYMVSRGW